jgi:HPt (histidine-containing phosphotransfer) domain-containing protein
MQTENNLLTAETTEEKLYDLCMIEKFCRGNQEQVKKMLQVFISSIPPSVEEIKAAYNNGDFAAVKKLAHRTKSAISYYAVVKMEKDMRQIEELAGAGIATAELESKIQKLETVISRIVEQMNKTLLYQ